MRTNFQMEYENIAMTKGDTVAFNCIVYDSDGEPLDVDSAFFTCKKRLTGETIFQKSLNNGISQLDGVMNIRIAPEDTVEIDEGIYFYDFTIGIADDVFTVKKGTFTIQWDCTY